MLRRLERLGVVTTSHPPVVRDLSEVRQDYDVVVQVRLNDGHDNPTVQTWTPAVHDRRGLVRRGEVVIVLPQGGVLRDVRSRAPPTTRQLGPVVHAAVSATVRAGVADITSADPEVGARSVARSLREALDALDELDAQRPRAGFLQRIVGLSPFAWRAGRSTALAGFSAVTLVVGALLTAPVLRWLAGSVIVLNAVAGLLVGLAEPANAATWTAVGVTGVGPQLTGLVLVVAGWGVLRIAAAVARRYVDLRTVTRVVVGVLALAGTMGILMVVPGDAIVVLAVMAVAGYVVRRNDDRSDESHWRPRVDDGPVRARWTLVGRGVVGLAVAKVRRLVEAVRAAGQLLMGDRQVVYRTRPRCGTPGLSPRWGCGTSGSTSSTRDRRRPGPRWPCWHRPCWWGSCRATARGYSVC